MSINGHSGIDEIVPRHFEAEGKASGWPKHRALELLDEMTRLLAPALERTRLALTEQVPESVSAPISTDAAQRTEQVRELL